ncbi:MAG TPA: sigma-70 family RNA polymerase sigma factor [Chloroflexota bacterium]|nr:sigma-70 family RNA polymerase sigma factor [Chloroflexota bacterium]
MSVGVLAHTFGAGWSVPVNARAEEPVQARVLSAEGQLILAARRRDSASFEALVRRHQAAIYNFCLRLLGQAEDAADVAQETFVQLYSHLDRLDVHEPLAPWLFRVARNRCIDIIRRRRTVSLAAYDAADEHTAVIDPADEDPLPDELVERADLQRLLTRAISNLPPTYAEVVALRYAGDRSFAEIALILDLDEGTARVRFHRAKALLRRSLRASLDLP